jgi:cobalt-zinc-cadmium efflux system outer membrane protein
MSLHRNLLLLGLLLTGGCLWPVREKTDQTVHDLISRPYDVAPTLAGDTVKETPQPKGGPSEPATKPTPKGPAAAPPVLTDMQTTAYMQAPPDKALARPKYDLVIPPEIPGSEAPLIKFEKTGPDGKPVPLSPEEKRRAIAKIYPELPPLPVAPKALSGPNGQPYTLADLQRMGAENSPTLRQAVSDVEAAKGNLLQAKAYPNPTFGYMAQPSNNNSTTGAQGIYFDQPIKTFGKIKLAASAAQKDLDNAELALRRARSDLSTAIRNAYFGLIVAQETERVTRALARFTDEIYRVHTGYLSGGFAASYEPAALRAQAYTTRLAYQQAIYGYIAAWKQLVAAIGLSQLPLSEVSGRVDRLIPYYDYDAVLAHALSRHTDVLTARNVLDKARYNLKLAQITPYPDFDVQAAVFKESSIVPFTIFHTVQVSVPLPLWDRNKGNIIAAQAALIRAEEESHRVEFTLTGNLAMAYLNYKNNLDALEYYRRFILPDQVSAYRGVFERRQIDINAQFGDLVAAQQALASGVTNYLGILGNLWSGAVSVADFLQTDDLFQMAKAQELPELPDLEQMPRWLCPHGRLPAGPTHQAGPVNATSVEHQPGCPPKAEGASASPTPAPAPGESTPLPAPRRFELPQTPPHLMLVPLMPGEQEDSGPSVAPAGGPQAPTVPPGRPPGPATPTPK